MHIPAIVTGLIIVALGCAPVEPGVLNERIRENEILRVYQECLQQTAQFPAEQRQICRRWLRVWIAQWEWEKCVNDYNNLRDCGLRPEWEDVP